MSLTPDWMREDNLGKSGPRRALRRALDWCLVIGAAYENRRRVVGAGFEEAKSRMIEEERAAIKGASSEDHLKQRVP